MQPSPSGTLDDGEATGVTQATLPTAATRSDRPSARGGASRGDLLRTEEASRLHGFSGACLVLVIIALFYQPVLADRGALKLAYLTALGLVGVVFFWTFLRTRDPRRYTRSVFRISGAAAVSAALVFLLYAGILSPVVGVFTLGVAFFGTGDDRRWAIGLCVGAIAVYVAITVLVITHTIPDFGLTPIDGQPWRVILFHSLIAPTALGITLWQARLSRSATHRAVDDLHEALRLANLREVQLQEAYQDVMAARKAGAGRLGRYTGYEAGRYELAAVIGRGAMGEVYAAFHRESGESAAVKVLLSGGDEDRLRRFEREGQITIGLRSSHVVRVFEVGAFEDDTPYMVMEFLKGTDLSTLLRRRRRMEPADLCVMAEQVADGLDAAHAAGVIHRDIKPHNLFFCADAGSPLWKILDFGVSRAGDSTGTLTEGAVVGTPGYMSPEQARGDSVDHRADVFAFGAVVYRCLTGQQPFHGASMPETLFDIVYHQPVRPRDLVADLPPDVEKVLLLALAKTPGRRFADASSFARALIAAFDGNLAEPLRARAAELEIRAPWRPSSNPAALGRGRHL